MARAARRPVLLFSAEHATNAVPAQLISTFSERGAQKLLNSHRGWDPGSLEIARFLARHFKAPCVAARVSRLVVDANRSPRHRSLFSEWTSQLPTEERRALLAEYHRPHWSRVEDWVGQLAHRGPVLHCAIHSFTPRWEGELRRTEIGLLYDPRRQGERTAVIELQRALRASTGLRVNRNAPYRGISDGLPTALRRKFSEQTYWGLEIEVNQKLVPTGLEHVKKALASALSSLTS